MAFGLPKMNTPDPTMTLEKEITPYPKCRTCKASTPTDARQAQDSK